MSSKDKPCIRRNIIQRPIILGRRSSLSGRAVQVRTRVGRLLRLMYILVAAHDICANYYEKGVGESEGFREL